MYYFNNLKRILIDKGIPIVIGEIGIYNKLAEKNSIRQFLYSIFSISSENEGILPCLWDISEKIEGEMKCYYNKETNEWYDEKIGENFLKISKGNFIKPKNYYYKNNIETDDSSMYDYIHIDIGSKKVKTIILNVKIVNNYISENDISVSIITCYKDNDISVSIITCYKDQEWYEIECLNGKRQYDGSITFTIDVSNIECYYYVEALSWWGYEYVILNYLTLIYEEKYSFFDYKSFKSAVLKEINK